MIKHDHLIYFLVFMIMFALVCSIAGQAKAQWWYPFNPYLGFNPYFLPYSPLPYAFYPTFIAPYPFMSAPVLTPPPTRVGAATLIITNPTAGTAAVTVINPTVASVPAVATAVAPSPTPLLSLLATLYSSALYEGLLSTANPLLFATLQYLFL